MGQMFRRGGVVTSAVAGFMALSTAAALAHECVNASRSERGNAMAGTRSQAWYQVVIEDEVAWEVDMGLYTAEEGECAYGYWLANGGPERFTVHVKGANGQDGTIASRNPNEDRLHDGKGIELIDHLFPLYVESLEACGVDTSFIFE